MALDEHYVCSVPVCEPWLAGVVNLAGKNSRQGGKLPEQFQTIEDASRGGTEAAAGACGEEPCNCEKIL